MPDEFPLVARTIEEAHREESALTRRRLVGGAAVTLGGMGLLSLPGVADAKKVKARASAVNDPQTILNIAATAEVLATIVNTVGAEVVNISDPVTLRNIRAAAREELIHYDTLVATGGTPLTKQIWVPNSVFHKRTNLLSTLEVGDQIFVNAYLVAVKTFAAAGNGDLALIAAEFMGVEAVHRALARQSLGKLGNDRVFMRYDQKEMAPDAPNVGQPGFEDITVAAAQLQAAGFGFGAKGAEPGQFYDFDEVRKRTPTDPDLNTTAPDTN
jgi:hypothetical protein